MESSQGGEGIVAVGIEAPSLPAGADIFGSKFGLISALRRGTEQVWPVWIGIGIAPVPTGHFGRSAGLKPGPSWT